MNLKLTFAIAFSLTTSAFAAMTDAQLAQGMRTDINKYTFTMKTARLVFHWADASDITPQGQFKNSLPAIGPSFPAYVNKQGGKIFRARDVRDGDIEGPGLYLAGSPTSTRSYGGQKSFGLIVGLIRPGSKILNGDGANAIAPNLLAEITARGCQVYDNNYNTILDSAGDAKCLKIKQLLVGSDASFVDGRMYNYSNTYMIHGCSQRNPYKDIQAPASKIRDFEGLDTFVGYSTKLFSEVMGITNKTTVSNHALSNQVLSWLKGLQTHNLAQDAGYVISSPEQMADAKIPAMSKAEIAKFSQKYILGCNL
ncbi:MAG: hypothetical protein V4598_10105 [Bdellovibrionota bacterium]